MSEPVEWTLCSVAERLAEAERLRRERHGAALDEPMALTCRIVNISTGWVLFEAGDGSPRLRGRSSTSGDGG